MPVSSYLVFPCSGAKDIAHHVLENIPHCQVKSALNHDCLLLVTDTPDEASETALRERLETLPQLAGMALVFGARDEVTEMVEGVAA